MQDAPRMTTRRTWAALGFTAVVAGGLALSLRGPVQEDAEGWTQAAGVASEEAESAIAGDAAQPADAGGQTVVAAPDVPPVPVTPEPAVAEVAGDPVAADPAASAPEAVAPEVGTGVPVFDIVRIEPDGSALIAGTAEPKSRVAVLADSRSLIEVEADRDGNFVAIFEAAPSGNAQALTLQATSPEGLVEVSDEVVMLLPGGTPGADTEGFVPATGLLPDQDGVPALTVPATAPEQAAGEEPAGEATVEQAALAVTPEPTIAATAVVRGNGVEVSRSSAAAAALGFELVSISYSGSGGISLTGVGPAGTKVRAYVDNAASGEVEITGNGDWVLDLSDLAEGLYALRLDQIDGAGRVARRVETPFQRDFPTMPMARPGYEGPVSGAAGVQVTVQPGGTLWTLARQHYGAGVLFTQIFTANEKLIRDPDLIYPGQVLAIPDLQQP